jgi:hypothetical protein
MDEEESRLIEDIEICEIRIWYANKQIDFWESKIKTERECYLQLLKRAKVEFVGKYVEVPVKKEEGEEEKVSK